MVLCSKVATDVLRNLLNQAFEQHAFTFIDNDSVKHNNLWNDGAHLLEQGRMQGAATAATSALLNGSH